MRTMKYATATLLLFVAALAIFKWVDTAVSLNFARQQQRIDKDRINTLYALFTSQNRGASRLQIQSLIRRVSDKNHIVKEDNSHITFDNIVFVFDSNGGLTETKSLDDDTGDRER